MGSWINEHQHWIVVCETSDLRHKQPNRFSKHPSYASARHEAERLAAMSVGCKFVIYKSVAHSEATCVRTVEHHGT